MQINLFYSATATDSNTITITTQLLDALVGRHGGQGGSSATGGATYTRWGKTTCPQTRGTTLVYSGAAAGSFYNYRGGGSNYLCLPQQAEYLSTQCPPTNHWDWLYGAEYEYPISGVGTRNHNAPCSVCYVSNRAAQIMIPGKVTCPESWTEEYQGYLMSERYSHQRSAQYICVDQNAENFPNTGANTNGALLYHVIALNNVGLPSSYVRTRVVTCVVCTK